MDSAASISGSRFQKWMPAPSDYQPGCSVPMTRARAEAPSRCLRARSTNERLDCAAKDSTEEAGTSKPSTLSRISSGMPATIRADAGNAPSPWLPSEHGNALGETCQGKNIGLALVVRGSDHD